MPEATNEPDKEESDEITEATMGSPAPAARSDAGVEHVALQFGQQLGPDLQSHSRARERVGLPMNTTESTYSATQGATYVGLHREMHDALRAQNPEWIEANGDCPTCDSYESRLAQLLGLSLAFEQSHAH